MQKTAAGYRETVGSVNGMRLVNMLVENPYTIPPCTHLGATYPTAKSLVESFAEFGILQVRTGVRPRLLCAQAMRMVGGR